jgi:hypothetical protein
MVLHRSGEEGIDELWGEPFKAFVYPIEKFYESRYIKIAECMRQIDEIRDELSGALEVSLPFAGVRDRIDVFADAAKIKCETLRTDDEIFDIWTSLVVSGERLAEFDPSSKPSASPEQRHEALEGAALIRHAKDLVFWVTRARVAMPKSTADFVALCRRFRDGYGDRAPPRSSIIVTSDPPLTGGCLDR